MPRHQAKTELFLVIYQFKVTLAMIRVHVHGGEDTALISGGSDEQK